ncbi:hypothetical protein BX286_0020 [Streptomyces sp. 3211.6]|uniref:WD40 repeat domain-containing protein n=1 Tax=Streptomyces sp. 3211.6 TaxID=1938845 RepID=UPI000EAD20DC|nr:hypothetical protein [Streptomyces sp. 3211.6]RKT02156.1 hypothetical protein BX286_0020 [Streptomyces sp. 3211.6]
MAFSPAGGLAALICTGSGISPYGARGPEATMELFDLSTHSKISQLVPSYVGHGSKAVFSPDGRLLATTYGDTVFLYDTSTHQYVRQLVSAPTGTPAFSPDSRLLATVSSAGVLLWILPTTKTSPKSKLLANPLEGK